MSFNTSCPAHSHPKARHQHLIQVTATVACNPNSCTPRSDDDADDARVCPPASSRAAHPTWRCHPA
eukprot:404058-Pelagomonas_calceolata.AAC.1